MTASVRKERARRRPGEGSFTQKANGLWVGRLQLPPDPVTGKRRIREVTSMDEREAVRKLNKLKRSLEDHGNLPTGSETVAKYMAYWIESVDRSRPRTRAGYRSKIEQYIVPAIGKIKLDQLAPADVRRLEQYIVTTKELSSTSARQAYQILSKALKDAMREGRVVRNVATLVDPPPVAVPKLKVLSASEAVTVLGYAAETRLGSRWAMALLTGARQGEVLGLEIERIDFKQCTIDLDWQLQRIAWRHGESCRIIGSWPAEGDMPERPRHECGHKRGTDCPTRKLDAPADWDHRYVTGGLYLSRPKSRAGWRVIPLVEPLRTILERRVAVAGLEPNPHGLVWTADPKQSKGGKPSARKWFELDGSPIDPSRDNRAWHKLLAEAGVTDVRLHDARHTAVSLMFDLGIAETTIQDIVGQSTIAATRGYRHKNRALAADALAQVSEALGTQLSQLVLTSTASER